MSFVERGETIVGAHTLEELKLVYRVLHRHLGEHTELMDTHFLIELQRYLQDRAAQEGVDPSHHGAWDAWLGNMDVPPCDVRVERRRVVE
jgi:hypothetical protein